MTVWLVRHAPVAVAGICYGQSDVPLRITAREAADAVYPQVAGLGLSRIVTSPWDRTRGLAEALASRLHVNVVVDARIAELAMGAWEGRAFAELERDDGVRFARWMEAWETEAPPDGESLPALLARVASWIDEPREGPELAVTHAGAIRAMRALVRGVSYTTVLDERVEHLRVEALGSPKLPVVTPG